MSTGDARKRLLNATWLSQARPFFDCLDGSAGTTRAVGGIVRDTLLGIERSNTDIDLATMLLPQEVMQRAKAAGLAAHPTGIDHGTVTLVARGVIAEVTALREDVETFGRQAEVRFGTSWRRDAERRDFTMNALYCSAGGVLSDPLDGLADCLARRVRFIGDPDQRIAEDRLRVYRYFRFAASHGRQVFDEQALAACGRAAGMLDMLSAERVGAEMTRLLSLPTVVVTLEKMRAAGVLASTLISDTVLEALRRYEEIVETPQLAVRLAMIAGDATGLGFLKDHWRLSNALLRAAENIHAGRKLAQKSTWNALAYRFPDQKLDILAAFWSSSNRPEREFRDTQALLKTLAPPAFPLGGHDLAAEGLDGRELGDALRRLEAAWIESGFQLNRHDLLRLI